MCVLMVFWEITVRERTCAMLNCCRHAILPTLYSVIWEVAVQTLGMGYLNALVGLAFRAHIVRLSRASLTPRVTKGGSATLMTATLTTATAIVTMVTVDATAIMILVHMVPLTPPISTCVTPEETVLCFQEHQFS